MKSEPEKSRKLVLTRETIMPLQDDELAGVYGGATPASVSWIASVSVSVISRSSRACIQAISKSVSKVVDRTRTSTTTTTTSIPNPPASGQPPQGGNRPGGGNYPPGYEE